MSDESEQALGCLDIRADRDGGVVDGTEARTKALTCFYCDHPIAANQAVVEGKEAVAHRECVRERLEERCPGASEYELQNKPRPPTCHPGRPRQSHCTNGHEFKDGSFYIRKDGRRACRLCRQLRQRVRYARKKVTQ